MLYFAAVVPSAVGPKRSLKSKRFNCFAAKDGFFLKRCSPCVFLPEEWHTTRWCRLWKVAWPEDTFSHPEWRADQFLQKYKIN